MNNLINNIHNMSELVCNKNILIYPHNPFSYANGGMVVQFYLAKLLDEMGVNVRMYPSPQTGIVQNSIFNKFYNNDFLIDENTVVIYCEGIIGNPLNATNVVRWMLSVLGQNVPYDWVNTWGKNELVYYFNSELKFITNPEKVGNIYKLLTTIYVNPDIKQINYNERPEMICYTIRKAHHIHKSGIMCIHPPNSFEITWEHEQEDYIKIFNQYKYFVSYDSNTFLINIALFCGCIPIVYPVNGQTKLDWLHTTAMSEYLKHNNLDNFYGISYGIEDIQYAIDTMHLAKQQWDDVVRFNKQTFYDFINDMNNFENMKNTISNNYFV